MSRSTKELGLFPKKPLELFRGLSLEEIKQQVAKGVLLSSLQEAFVRCGKEYALTEILVVKERHKTKSSFLILRFEFKSTVSATVIHKEVVVQFPYCRSKNPDETIRFWYYPEDPLLTTLGKLFPVQPFLKSAKWEKALEEMYTKSDRISIQQILYKPGRRAAFLLSFSKTERKLNLKIVQSKNYTKLLRKIEVTQKALSKTQILFPKLISYSIREKAFLYDYLPGLRIDKVKLEQFNVNKSSVLEAVVQILREIHQTAIPLLPVWNPAKQMNQMCSFFENFKTLYPKVFTVIIPIIEKLSVYFNQKTRAYTHMIHSDFEVRHILYNTDSIVLPTKKNLAVIDWDDAALGPREKDIGSFLSNYSEEAEVRQLFINLYQQETGSTLDLALLNCFIQYKHLMHICTKIIRRCDRLRMNSSLWQIYLNALITTRYTSKRKK